MSDTEKMLADILFEELEADFGQVTDTDKVTLPVVRRSKFSYELDAFGGEDIRRGLQVVAPEDYEFDQIRIVSFESYEEMRERALERMKAFLEPRLKNGLGPLLAIRGQGVCAGLTNTAGKFEMFSLRSDDILFGSLQGVGFGDFPSLAHSELREITDARQIGELPLYVGGVACLERVDICVRDGSIVREQAEVAIPIHEPGLTFSLAYPIS